MAIKLFKIPLANVPQRFALDLSGRSLILVSQWNGEMPAWALDILDGLTGLPLVASLPLVSGVDLLAQHSHLGIPGQLIVSGDGATPVPPTLDNLGVSVNLYYVTNT